MEAGKWRLVNGGWSLNFPFKGVDQAIRLVHSGTPFQTIFWYGKRVSKMSLLSRVLAPKTEPKSRPKRKNRSKFDLEIKLRFLIDLLPLGSQKWRPRTSIILPKPFVLLYGSENPLFRHEAVFVSMLVPTWLHLGTIFRGKWEKSEPAPTSKIQSIFEGFLIDFWTILVSKKDDFFVAETSFFAPKSVSDPRLGHLGPSLAILYPVLAHVGLFGLHFESFGTHFGSISLDFGHHFRHKFGTQDGKNKKRTPNTSIQISTVADTARLRNWIYIRKSMAPANLSLL